MENAVRETRGGVFALSGGMPDLRRVSNGRVAAGRTWMGITPREAYTAVSSSKMPLIPAWLWMIALTGWIIFTWLREGRR